jgi:hypothetical protein
MEPTELAALWAAWGFLDEAIGRISTARPEQMTEAYHNLRVARSAMRASIRQNAGPRPAE